MIIVVDVGNTNITVGMFCQEKIVGHYRMTTQMARTSDEYGVLLRDFLGDAGFKAEDVEDVVIASVVPSIMYSLNHAIKKYFHVTPIVVGPGIKTGIKIGAENPKEGGRGSDCGCRGCQRALRRGRQLLLICTATTL